MSHCAVPHLHLASPLAAILVSHLCACEPHKNHTKQHLPGPGALSPTSTLAPTLKHTVHCSNTLTHPLTTWAMPAAVDAPPLAPSSPFAGSPSPGHCAQAKPVGPTSSKMAWSSPKGSPMAESGGPGADTEEMSDVEVEAPLAQVRGWQECSTAQVPVL